VKKELVKYLIAGGIAFTCDFLVLLFCKEILGIHYLIANIFGYFSGLIVAYALNVNWVFDHRKYQKAWVEFLIFNVIVFVGLGISEGIMAYLVDISGIYYVYAKIVASAFVMIFNYTAKKFLLFHPTTASRQH
jgi:putative flippase GtrA